MKCPSCKCHVTPAPPKTIWKVINVAFLVAAMIVSTAFSLALGLNLVLAPTAIVIGFAVGTSARRLVAWTCPNCHEELVEPAIQTTFNIITPTTTTPTTPTRPGYTPTPLAPAGA